MEAARYRIVLTGEVLEGHQLERVIELLAKLFKQPPEKVARFFGNRPLPLAQEFDQTTAGKVRDRILAAGANCKVEQVAAPPAFALDQDEPKSTPPKTDSGFHCPKCGHAQTPSESCGRCGIIFAKYQARAAEPERAAPEPTNPNQLAELFIGPNADYYLERFPQFRAAGLSLSWNWPAFFVFFFWALYRKLWLWAAVFLFIAMIPLVNLLSPFVFASLANYLYFRQVEAELERLQRLKRSPEQIARAGGVSRLAVWVAAAVMGLTITAAVSLLSVSMRAAQDMQDQVSIQDNGDDSLESRRSRANMGVLMLSVAMLKMGGEEMEGLTIDDLQEKLQLRDEQLQDGWGGRLALSIQGGQVTFSSAGPDGTFNTEDDLRINGPL